jgi:hypothetical protein
MMSTRSPHEGGARGGVPSLPVEQQLLAVQVCRRLAVWTSRCAAPFGPTFLTFTAWNMFEQRLPVLTSFRHVSPDVILCFMSVNDSAQHFD